MHFSPLSALSGSVSNCQLASWQVHQLPGLLINEVLLTRLYSSRTTKQAKVGQVKVNVKVLLPVHKMRFAFCCVCFSVDRSIDGQNQIEPDSGGFERALLLVYREGTFKLSSF